MPAIEVRDDRSTQRERVLVVERLVVGHTGTSRVHLRPTQLLGRDVLAGRRLHERRAAQEDRSGALHDDGLVAHRGHVRAAGSARTHDQRHLRDRGCRHPGLVVEDPPEVVTVREHVGLERQEGAAAVHEIDARQPVLERDLLGAQVLLDGHRVVGAALDRGVVGDDHAGRALDAADAGDDAGARCVVVVQAVRGQRTQLQEGRAGVEQAVDALADGQLAAFAVALDRAVVAAGAAIRKLRLAPPELVDEGGHRVMVRARLRCGRVEPAAEDGHGPMIGRNRRHAATVPRPCRHRSEASWRGL